MSDEVDHLHMAIRGQLVRGVVRAIDDTGAVQTVTVDTHFGRTRSAVPVYQPFGFSGYAPLDGAVAHVFQNGADPSDLVALPPHNPSAARMGNIAPGESVMYDGVGQKIYLMGGQIVRIDALSELQVRIGGTTVLDVTAEGATLNVPLNATQGITTTTVSASGDVKAGNVSLQEHTHPVSGNETQAPNA